MKIYNINPISLFFKGKREDKKTVTQLKTENKYDLNVMNQRKISNAIENLSEIPGEENVEFLMDVSENLKYGTNINLGKASFNDWQVKLNNAALKSLSKSPKDVQERLGSRLNDLISSQKPLTEDEKEILDLRKTILSQVDQESLEKIKDKNIKQLNRNLDYFIVSSEVSLSQKLYIMKQLEHFMSPEYKINPQLEDKKTQALAEIINDITVDTPESEIPNIKAVNQKSHGMCAAISICRKSLAYEDKANFVDMVMSELDSSDYLQVYDITKLGTHTKVPINKPAINYDYALSKGYRILDTAALNWMHVGDTNAGTANDFVGMYSSFDKDFFDTFHDSHLLPDLDDTLTPQQDYYRALMKAETVLGGYKKSVKKNKAKRLDKLQNNDENVRMYSKYSGLAANIIREISPSMSLDAAHSVLVELDRLEVVNSKKANEIKDYKRDFVYLPNETKAAKLEKIKAFLSIALPEKDVSILNKKAPELLEIMMLRKGFVKDGRTTSYAASQINKARLLYDAAAAYRTQQEFSLEIPEVAEDMLISMNLPDRETRIIKNIDMLIAKLEKGKLNPKIREVLANNFQTDNDPEALIEALKENKETLSYVMTGLLDDFYKSCLSVSRKNVLLNEITSVRDAIKEGSDKTILPIMASNLHVKENKKAVLDLLDKYINVLQSEDCTNEQYIAIYNKVGKRNQMKDFKEIYERLGSALFENEDNQNLIMGFNLVNGLSKDAPREETIRVFGELGNNFNSIFALITSFQQALEVQDNEDVLNTVDTKETIIKKLENMGEIISKKDLEVFQERFSKIENARSSVNGQRITAKDLPSELTKFSKHEKEVLDLIESRINGWYSHVHRSLELQHKNLQEPLEELNRQVGVKTGQKWVSKEGGTGLASYQEIKIIEHMTDRPYYAENNTRLAVNKLKDSPYSGISCTSVSNKEPAWHAQYIVDIKPVKVKTPTGVVDKEALFHDNTWGPIEHENTWVDDSSFMRTDYSDNYGGDLGYITDEKFRTGKLLENLVGAVGVSMSNGGKEEYKFPMFYDVIMPGKSPTAASYVRRIRENAILSPIQYFEDLEKYTKNMTTGEVRAVIAKTETLGENIDLEYSGIEARIIGKEPFNKGIRTLDDYNKLPDDDKLKLLFEKLAIIKSYQNIPDSKIFYKELSMKELKALKHAIRKEARKNFDYSFGKNPDIAIYGTESSRVKVSELLDKFAKDNNLKFTPSAKIDYVNALKRIKKDDFDGSLDTTVDLMMRSFIERLVKKTPDFDKKDVKIKALANDVRSIIRTNMGFTLADLGSSSFESQNFVKWVDKTFAPGSDEEFVQVFKKLQNMTSEEFNRKYGDKISDEDIGFKPVTGFDILSQFRSYDEKTQNSVFNMLFYQKLGYSLKMSKTIPYYDHKKFKRVLRGARYVKGERSFDDIYLDYFYSLKSLTISKQYDKYKKQIFDKYRMFPAYPKMEVESPEEIHNMMQNLYDSITNSIEAIDVYKVQDKSYNMVNNLYKYASKLDADKPISDRQRKYVMDKVSEFLAVNGEDTSIETTINAANAILSLPENAAGSEYKKLITNMYDEISLYSTTADGKTMLDAAKSEIENINSRKLEFMMNVIEPKYQRKGYEILNKWISAKAKNQPEADEYFRDFELFFNKHKLLNSPEKMLNEYLLLLAKPDGHEKYLSKEQINQQKDVKEVYSTNLKGMLYSANILDLQYILMDCAGEANLNIVRDEFKNSQIQLRDGSVVNLESDQALSIILSPLLANGDLDTALMFIEQLGLTDRVVDMFTRDLEFKKAYANIKRIDSIFTAVSKQTKIVEQELKKLGDIDNDPDYKEKVLQTKAIVAKRCRNTNYRATAGVIEAAFDTALKEIEAHPEHSKTAFLNLYMVHAKDASLYVAQRNVQMLNSKLQAFQNIVNMMRRIKVQKDSPSAEKLQKYFDSIQKLEDFAAQHSGRYENLKMTTVATDEA